MCIAAADRPAVDCAIAAASLRVRSVDLATRACFQVSDNGQYAKSSSVIDAPEGPYLGRSPPSPLSILEEASAIAETPHEMRYKI